MMAMKPDPGAGLDAWLAYLEVLHAKPIDMGLDRVRTVAQRLGLELPCVKIVVAGTNGKGSTCAMLEAMLLAAGYTVGLYTSPHLIAFNERIRLDGRSVPDERIVEQFERIEAARGTVSLTYFEVATLGALLIFQESAPDVAVLEVGLGGRLDAVNIVDADCAIVTSIDLDHMEWLGNTRDEIAFDKAHVFRPGRPAICADPMAPKTLVDHAEAIGADLWLFGRDFNYSGDRLQWAYGGRQQRRSSLAYPSLRGANQLLNASAALAALEALRDQLVVPQQAVRMGLQASLPGRLQILPGQPTVVLDVAHNPHAAAALGQNLDGMGFFAETHAVVGMMADKDIAGVIGKLATRVDHWYCAGLPAPRGKAGADLAAIVNQVLPTISGDPGHAGERAQASVRTPTVSVRRSTLARSADKPAPTVASFDDPVAAFQAAQERAAGNDRILVFGSFATVGPVLKCLGREVY